MSHRFSSFSVIHVRHSFSDGGSALCSNPFLHSAFCIPHSAFCLRFHPWNPCHPRFKFFGRDSGAVPFRGQFIRFQFSALCVSPIHYGVGKSRKFLMIKPLQKSAFSL